jgi:glycosyltransferase involved in cell wall biosynthesis
MHEPIEVEYHCAAWSGTGYAEAARTAILALHQAGCRVRVDPSGFGKSTIEVFPHKITVKKFQHNHALKLPLEFRELIERLRYLPLSEHASLVIHAPSTVWHYYAGSKERVIGYTAWETSGMPEHWVRGCNLVDEVWIPCTHNVAALRRSGVEKPIFVIPHPIDGERFKPAEFRLNGMFTFVSVFRWGARKGWQQMFQAFEKAFKPSDPVILRVLTNFKTDEHLAEAAKVREYFAQPGKPRVEISPVEYIGYDVMPTLYGNADAFVLPSRGEGFCLPCAEAMACGLPALVTNATGFLDYVDATNGYPLECHPEVSVIPDDPDRDHSAWVVCDVDYLAARMRECWEDEAGRLAKGAAARETILAKYNLPLVAGMMMQRLAVRG